MFKIYCSKFIGSRAVHFSLELKSAFSRLLVTAICTVLLDPRDPLLQSERTQDFTADPVYGRAKCLPMLGAFKT